jgi:hypothetical protein
VDTSSEGFLDMASGSGGSGDMASGSGGHKSHGRKAAGLEWDVYNDNIQKARAGWETVPQPWSAKTAMQYVGFPHFDRLWPRSCHEKHCKAISASYMQLEDVDAKWRFLTILRSISNLDRWPKSAIPKSVACMMYAEHVLRVRVDWSSLGALHDQKFGGIGIAFTKCTVPDIPYTPVPDWFKKNPRLVDEPGVPIPDDREPKKPRNRKRPANDVEMAIEEAFEHMDEGMEANVEVVNNVINEVVNNALNVVNLGADTMESRMEELRKQHAEEIREYKARIFELENQVATLTMGEAGSSSCTPINLQSLEAERDTALKEARIAQSQALEVRTTNEVMRREMEALQKEVVDMQQQLQVVNEVVVDREAKIGDLEEQNARLKQFLSDAIVERKNMRTGTLLAMAKARQFEAEFESIQKEWNRNQRMRNMMLTSWPEDERMYPSRWDENHDLTLPNGSINWRQLTDEDHHWDMTQVHEYPFRMAGLLLWPNPHSMVFDGSVCMVCQSPFGPEGCFQVGSCGAQFHPQCLISNMIKKRQCPHCRSPFHPRLYLQFGLRDYMPKDWVLRPTDFPFELCEFDGENVEWSWLYNCAKVELWNEHKKGEWRRDPRQILYVANELYPNKPPEHGLKRFLYQTLGWHWDTTSRQLKRGRHPPWYNAAGLESVSELELEEDAHDMPGRGDSILELQFETRYHKHRLQLAAIDALLHRVTDDAVLRWLNGGPRPRNATPLSPGSRPYLTRGTLRSIEAGESSRARRGSSSAAIDLDSD